MQEKVEEPSEHAKYFSKALSLIYGGDATEMLNEREKVKSEVLAIHEVIKKMKARNADINDYCANATLFLMASGNPTEVALKLLMFCSEKEKIVKDFETANQLAKNLQEEDKNGL
jgi:hypothetical protein